MQSNLYPVGESCLVKGYPLKDIFGIVFANITAPDNLYAPILLFKNKDGRVIAPTGSWEGWYCSEELKLAVKYGYQVEVIKGYHWENKANIFKGYVDTLYSKRLSFPKTDPRNNICKLLLNSLYGKFGMSPTVMEYSIFTGDLEELFDIDYQDRQEIDGMLLVGREVTKNRLADYKYSQDKKVHQPLLEVSTPVAVFTTAYARMHMAKFKMEYANNLYYSDTDSLILDCPLPDDMVGSQLGQFKLEYKVKEGVFLAPQLLKVYSLVLDNDTKVTKIKGSKTRDVPFNIIKDLLNKDSNIILNQNKWLRDVQGGGIQILNSLYTLELLKIKEPLFILLMG
jgi:hypothetical protein